jgi:hypothetical protein
MQQFFPPHRVLPPAATTGPGTQCDGEDWLAISALEEFDFSTVHVYERHMVRARPCAREGGRRPLSSPSTAGGQAGGRLPTSALMPFRPLPPRCAN